MPEYSFALVLTGLDELSYDLVDALFEAGCDDATFGSRDGVCFGDFDRDAESAGAAIASAVQQVESVPPLTVHHAEPGEYVSLGLIAQRLGRSRESIRQLAVGLRGPGGFPVPVSGIADRTRLWRWPEVVDWWERAFSHELDPTIGELARAIERFNARRRVRLVPSSRDDANAVCGDVGVPGEDREGLQASLRDQQAVEGIAVDRW